MRARPVRWAIRAIVASPLLVCLGYLFWNQAHSNFAPIVAGQVYRSGQMSPGTLSRTIRRENIKTVLNLRGPNPKQSWYRGERTATLAGGATQVDISMSSCEWMSRAQLRTIVHTLDTAERPLLIHCQWGSERTGLVSAFSALLRPGSTLDDARAQFSIWRLFVPNRDGRTMLGHVEQYAAWLRRQGKPHSPERFRQWAVEGFRPQIPGREQWPFDPYPLIVVTRPDPSARAAIAQRRSTRAGTDRVRHR